MITIQPKSTQLKTSHPKSTQLTTRQEGSFRLPASVQMCQTTVGEPHHASGYASQNMAFHVADYAPAVHNNRMQLLQSLQNSQGLQASGVQCIHWLTQVHGTQVLKIAAGQALTATPVAADALITQEKGVALAMMTADCLPVLLTDAQGKEVAAIHAGWRGLAAGIIEKTIEKMQYKPAYAWIGAAIHQAAFEVGEEVFTAFTTADAAAKSCFYQAESKLPVKYMADLPALAVQRLAKLGVQTQVAEACSYADDRFYSHRQATHQQNQAVGRMASVIWLR